MGTHARVLLGAPEEVAGCSKASFLFGILWIATAPLLAPVRAADRWSGASCGSFTVYGDVGPVVSADVALRLQQFRLILETLAPDLAPRASDPVAVYVLADGLGALPLGTGGKRNAGLFLTRPTGSFIVIDPRDASESLEIVQHEYTHYAISLRFPDPPLWFSEGIAVFLANARVDAGGVIVRVSKYDLFGLRHSGLWIPLRDLLTADEGSRARNERPGLFYAESWALTHYVLAGNAGRREALFRFVTSGRRRFSDAAFHDAFGGSVEDIERDLKEYLRREVVPEPTFSSVEGRSGLTVTHLHPSKTDAEVLHGNLLVQFGPKGAAQAIDLFRRATHREEGRADAWSGLGEAASLLSRHEEAEKAHRRATTLAPDDPLVFYRFGEALLAQIPPPVVPGSVTTARRAREQFRRALTLRPGHGESHLGVARSCIGDPEALEEGLAAIGKAMALAPYEMEPRILAARLRIAAGRMEEASADLDAAIREASDPELLESTRRSLVEGLTIVGEDLLGKGEAAAAVSLLERVTAIPPLEDQRAAVRRMLDRARGVGLEGAARTRSGPSTSP